MTDMTLDLLVWAIAFVIAFTMYKRIDLNFVN